MNQLRRQNPPCGWDKPRWTSGRCEACLSLIRLLSTGGPASTRAPGGQVSVIFLTKERMMLSHLSLCLVGVLPSEHGYNGIFNGFCFFFNWNKLANMDASVGNWRYFLPWNRISTLCVAENSLPSKTGAFLWQQFYTRIRNTQDTLFRKCNWFSNQPCHNMIAVEGLGYSVAMKLNEKWLSQPPPQSFWGYSVSGALKTWVLRARSRVFWCW